MKLIQYWLFLFHHLRPECYELCECDTDSLYLAIARESVEECVKPEMVESWNANKHLYLASSDSVGTVEFDGVQVSRKSYDKRTPGLFKEEFVGDGIACHNSKVYMCVGENEVKTSCKGTQKKRNDLRFEDFLAVLMTGKSKTIENAGFITQKDQYGPTIKTYVQKKTGLSYFYAKRKVLSDGVSTTYLDI